MVGSVGADLVRFIQHGVVENRMCAFAPSQRGCVGVVFEAKESLGGTPAVRRRLAGSFAQLMSVVYPCAWCSGRDCLRKEHKRSTPTNRQ